MIKRIGVIGAGQMGSGIAHVCALKGFDIRLMDVDQPHLNSGIENIGRNMDRQIGRGMIRPEDKDAAMLPHRVGGNWALIHRPVTVYGAHIWISYSPDLRHWGSHRMILQARRGAWWGDSGCTPRC